MKFSNNTFFPVRIVMTETGEEMVIERVEDMPDNKSYQVVEVSPLKQRRKLKKAS